MSKEWIRTAEPWQHSANCRGLGNAEINARFFPYAETPYALKNVKSLCDFCPVRGFCLKDAMDSGSEGLWAATTTRQRRAMVRTRTRVKCPLCKSRSLTTAGEHEICLGCGASWKSDERPQEQQEETIIRGGDLLHLVGGTAS